jgi:hypothetical protein
LVINKRRISIDGGGLTMSKQRMIVTDDQLLVDTELIFNAIREAGGNWEQVEQEMNAYLEAVQGMVSQE